MRSQTYIPQFHHYYMYLGKQRVLVGANAEDSIRFFSRYMYFEYIVL